MEDSTTKKYGDAWASGYLLCKLLYKLREAVTKEKYGVGKLVLTAKETECIKKHIPGLSNLEINGICFNEEPMYPHYSMYLTNGSGKFVAQLSPIPETLKPMIDSLRALLSERYNNLKH